MSPYPRPTPGPGKPFAFFQWNYGWGVWEEVRAKFGRRPDVVAAHVLPLDMRWNREFDALLRAVSDLGDADRTLGDCEAYQGSAHEEPMRSALRSQADARDALINAARAYNRSHARRARK